MPRVARHLPLAFICRAFGAGFIYRAFGAGFIYRAFGAGFIYRAFGAGFIYRRSNTPRLVHALESRDPSALKVEAILSLL